MRSRCIVRSLVAGIVVASLAVCSDTFAAPGACPSDSKLRNGGPTQISGEGPGTWWGLVVNGLLAAELVAVEDQIDYLNDIFDTDFATLDELKAYNLPLVRETWDENHNDTSAPFNCVARVRTLTIPTWTSLFSVSPMTESRRISRAKH